MGFVKVATHVLMRPSLWWTAVRQVVRMTPRHWWKHSPFLPVPRADYLEFRLVTQYGGDLESSRSKIEAADVVKYLEWCKQWNRES
ncbi:unannotated protein [freshwater metagenome]|uniref:Unannotated protein n=1 Tax=freshwater metagenome TaxID=449393 RepID=A0A6J6DI82_9ZZZZ|nr:hypothetical protein [Actinomycetota bacterium]MTA93126.1 hypothetical protein [Actinomycetota bacterium]